MCFLKKASVFVVCLGVVSAAWATDAPQVIDRKKVSQSFQKKYSQKADHLAAQANRNQTPKQAMSAHTEDLRTLMLALYESHPQELAKSAQISPREMTEWVFDGKFGWRFDGLRKLQDQQALDLLFDEQFNYVSSSSGF